MKQLILIITCLLSLSLSGQGYGFNATNTPALLDPVTRGYKILSNTNQIISQTLKVKEIDFRKRIIGWAKRDMLEKIEKKTFNDLEVKTTLKNAIITLFKIALKTYGKI